MENHMLSTSQDAALPRTSTTRADFPPLSTGDLYGTRYERLQFLAIINHNLFSAWLRNGAPELAEEFARLRDHFAILADAIRPEGHHRTSDRFTAVLS